MSDYFIIISGKRALQLEYLKINLISLPLLCISCALFHSTLYFITLKGIKPQSQQTRQSRRSRRQLNTQRNGKDPWVDKGRSSRFSGSNKATFEQIIRDDIDISDTNSLILNKISTTDIEWEFDDGFTEMSYEIDISFGEAVDSDISYSASFFCGQAGSIEDITTDIVVALDTRVENLNGDSLSVPFRYSLSVQGTLKQSNVVADSSDCNGDGPFSTPCMLETECLGYKLNNMVASLYQAMKDGLIYLFISWEESDSQGNSLSDGMESFARGQILVN